MTTDFHRTSLNNLRTAAAMDRQKAADLRMQAEELLREAQVHEGRARDFDKSAQVVTQRLA